MIRTFGHWPVYRDGCNWHDVRDVAHGVRALVIIIYNETPSPAGSNLGFYLGGAALADRAGLGTGGDLAVLRLLMFVFIMAPSFTVAGDISNIVRACVPEYPAFYRDYYHFVDYRPVFSMSLSSGLSSLMALPRWEMAFFSSPVNWATVLFRCGTKKIGS